jgi:hypothetical protein
LGELGIVSGRGRYSSVRRWSSTTTLTGSPAFLPEAGAAFAGGFVSLVAVLQSREGVNHH